MHLQKTLAQRRLSPNLREKSDGVVEFRCFFTHCNYIKPEPLLHTIFGHDVVRPWPEVRRQIVIASNDDNKIDVVWRDDHPTGSEHEETGSGGETFCRFLTTG